MTTTTNRRNTQELTERAASNDARQAGAIERNELPTLAEQVRARAIELWLAGDKDGARRVVALHEGAK